MVRNTFGLCENTVQRHNNVCYCYTGENREILTNINARYVIYYPTFWTSFFVIFIPLRVISFKLLILKTVCILSSSALRLLSFHIVVKSPNVLIYLTYFRRVQFILWCLRTILFISIKQQRLSRKFRSCHQLQDTSRILTSLAFKKF